MSTLYLTPETVDAFKTIIQDPAKHGLSFRPLQDCFEKCETVTPNHILAGYYLENEAHNLPKVFFYIIMEQIYGPAGGAQMGYYLQYIPRVDQVTLLNGSVTHIPIGHQQKFHLSTNGYYFIYRNDRNNAALIRATLYYTLYRPAGHADVKNKEGHLQVDDVAVSAGYGLKEKTHTDVINYFESRILMGQINPV